MAAGRGRYLETCASTRLIDRRDRALLLLGLASALRRSKLAALTVAGRFGRSPTRNSLRLPKRSIAQKQEISRRYGSMSWRLLLSGCFASHDRHHHPRIPMILATCSDWGKPY